MTNPIYPKIMAAVERQGEAFDAFVGSNHKRFDALGERADELQDRLESVEAAASSPGLTAGKRRAAEPAFKTYETGAGQIHELPFDVKVADAIGPADVPEVSFERWLGATMAGERCSDNQALEYAREQKQLTTTTSGVLIPEEFQSRWIDLIRAQSVLNAAGMTSVVMDAKTQTHSAVVTDPAATWHTEAASITADNPTFALRQMTAKTLVVRCQGSVELAQDSPDFGAQLAAVMAKAMGAELDRVGLVGSGTPPEPQGILGAAGVTDVAAVGTPTDFGDILGGVRTLLEANNPLDQVSANALMSPRTWATFEGLATGITSDKTQLPRPRSLEGMAFRTTTAVPNNLGALSPPVESVIFLGDFRDLLLGVRREASVESLKLTTYASNLLIEFVGYLRADFLIRRPSSFVTLSGVTSA